MPPKKLISAKDCDKVIKVSSQNAVNAYKKKSSGSRSKPNEYAMFVRQHMQDPKVKRLPVKQRMGGIALLWADAKKRQRVMFMDMSDLDKKDKKAKPKGNFKQINKERRKDLDDEKKHSN